MPIAGLHTWAARQQQAKLVVDEGEEGGGPTWWRIIAEMRFKKK
jgi:hypothetical protein